MNFPKTPFGGSSTDGSFSETSCGALLSFPMVASLLLLAMTLQSPQTFAAHPMPIRGIISEAQAEAAVAILDSVPHPVNVRLVYVGTLGAPDDPYAHLFLQFVEVFNRTNGRWQSNDIQQASQKDANTNQGQGIGCSAVDADGENGKIISSAMAALGYPCSHRAVGYTPPAPKPIVPSGRRPLMPHPEQQEVVISIGR
jgi:hypothetical protein